MIGEALEGLLATKEQHVTAEADALQAVEARKMELAAAVAAAEEELAAASETVKLKDEELCNSESSLVEAKVVLAAAEETARSNGEVHASREQELAEMQSVVGCFEHLKAGAEENEAEVARKVEAVRLVASRLQVESSLVSACPLALAKKLEERGPFDEVVCQEVRRVFEQEVGRIRSLVEEGLPAAADRAAAVAAVQAQVDAANSDANQRKSAFAEAREKRTDQKKVKDEAVAAVRAHEPALKQAALMLEAAEASRDCVVKVLANFSILKVRASKPAPDVAPTGQDADLPKVLNSANDVLEAAELGA